MYTYDLRENHNKSTHNINTSQVPGPEFDKQIGKIKNTAMKNSSDSILTTVLYLKLITETQLLPK